MGRHARILLAPRCQPLFEVQVFVQLQPLSSPRRALATHQPSPTPGERAAPDLLTAEPSSASSPSAPQPAPAVLLQPWAMQLYTGATCFLGISSITLPQQLGILAGSDIFILIGPFGASACLIFALPDGPFSQPRCVVGGHMWSALAGVMAYHASCNLPEAMAWVSLPLAVTLSVVGMMRLGVMHPPAAGTAVLACMTAQPLGFALAPVATGSVALVLAGAACSKLLINRGYPKHWF